MGRISATEILCPMKVAIRHYCHEGHNIITTHDMQIALDKRPVQGTTAAVFCVNKEKKKHENEKDR